VNYNVSAYLDCEVTNVFPDVESVSTAVSSEIDVCTGPSVPIVREGASKFELEVENTGGIVSYYLLSLNTGLDEDPTSPDGNILALGSDVYRFAPKSGVSFPVGSATVVFPKQKAGFLFAVQVEAVFLCDFSDGPLVSIATNLLVKEPAPPTKIIGLDPWYFAIVLTIIIVVVLIVIVVAIILLIKLCLHLKAKRVHPSDGADGENANNGRWKDPGEGVDYNINKTYDLRTERIAEFNLHRK
jgi:hypothetical protein